MKKNSTRNIHEILRCKHLHLCLSISPTSNISEKDAAMKEEAKRILSNISQGKEQVTTTVVHISEVVNILKNGMTKDALTPHDTWAFYDRQSNNIGCNQKMLISLQS